MNEEKIQQLKDALKQVVAMIVQRGQPLSPEVKQMLMQVMEHVAGRIQQLRKTEEAPEQMEAAPAASQIQPSGPSSNVEGFAYDPQTNKLMVRFLGEHPNRNGPIYAYEGVPPAIFDLLRKGAVPARTDGKNKWGKWWRGKVPSFGASVFTLVKNGGYPYQKVG